LQKNEISNQNNNDTEFLDRLIKVLIAIILAAVAYYLIFGF